MSDTFRVGVNVSPVELASATYADRVLSVLARHGVTGASLVLEITEGTVMDNDVSVAESLGRLRAAGVLISVDDFGTGYSSLARLRTLPIDSLKIDKAFVRELTPNQPAPFISAILAMAHSLQLRVVAEGVETPEQLATLRAHGCDLVQGYLVSRPLPADAVIDVVRHPSAAVLATVASDTTAAADTDVALMQTITDALRGADSAGSVEAGIRELLQLLQRVTGLESVYLTRIMWNDGLQEILWSHNAGALGITEGTTVAWNDTLCRAVIHDGRGGLSNVPEEQPHNAAARDLGIVTYLGVPVLASDGTMQGTLCGASSTQQGVSASAIAAMEVCARVLVEAVTRSE